MATLGEKTLAMVAQLEQYVRHLEKKNLQLEDELNVQRLAVEKSANDYRQLKNEFDVIFNKLIQVEHERDELLAFKNSSEKDSPTSEDESRAEFYERIMGEFVAAFLNMDSSIGIQTEKGPQTMKLRKLSLENLSLELRFWVDAVHGTAVEKGWWEGGERNVGEVFLLIKSEIIEAFEEYRNGKPLQEIYRKEGSEKPEGFPIEIADAVIRIMDYLGSLKMTPLFVSPDYPVFESSSSNLGEALDDIICAMSINMRSASHSTHHSELCHVIARLFKLCEERHVDLGAAILEKYEYNRTRPYRHGGKKA